MVERKITYRVLVGVLQGSGSFGRPKWMQKDNIAVSFNIIMRM
jgi:hypothetical protein